MPPGEPPVLTINDKGEVEVADARRTGNGLRAGMMRVVAEDDRLSFPRPGALEIGNRILCTRRSHASRQYQCERKISHLHPSFADSFSPTYIFALALVW